MSGCDAMSHVWSLPRSINSSEVEEFHQLILIYELPHQLLSYLEVQYGLTEQKIFNSIPFLPVSKIMKFLCCKEYRVLETESQWLLNLNVC